MDDLCLILYSTSIVEMKARRKTKQIEKAIKKAQKKGNPAIEQPQGEP